MRRLVASLALLAVLAAPSDAAPDPPAEVRYYLPLTKLRIHGTATTRCDLDATPPRVVVEGDGTVALAVHADPSASFTLDARDAMLANEELSVDVTGQALLSGVNSKSTGQAGAIIRNLFRFATTIGLVPGMRKDLRATPCGSTYANDHADHHALRESVKKSVWYASTKLADLESQVVAETKAQQRQALEARATDVGEALAVLNTQAATLDAHHESWRTRTEKKVTRRPDHLVDVAELPTVAYVRNMKSSQLSLQPRAADVLADLNLVVAIEEPTPAPPKSRQVPAGVRGLRHRVPRPIRLEAFTYDQNDDPVRLWARIEYVTDAKCEQSFIPLKKSSWGSRSTKVTFATSGAVTKLERTSTSALGDMAETAAALPGEMQSALEAAKGLIEAEGALDTQRIQEEVDRLKVEKELVDARVSRQTSFDLASMKAEKQLIDQRLELLRSQESLAKAGLEERAAVLALQERLLDLQRQLDAGAADRERLRLEIEKLKAKP